MNDDSFDPDADFNDLPIEEGTENQMELVEPAFPDVYHFVSEFLVSLYPVTTHRAKDVNWNGRWWKYPHAVVRLEALWQRFEQLRRDEPATFLETFLRVHADYHMAHLMADGGVFSDTKRQDFEASPLASYSPEGTK